MTKPTNSLTGLFTYGSPGYSAFSATGENSAVVQAAAAGYTQIVITDTSIASRSLNETISRIHGVEIRQGLVVQALLDNEKDTALLTLFPVAPDSEKLFIEWSNKYPQASASPMNHLPYGTKEPAPLFLQVPLEEIQKRKNLFLICNSTLEGNTAIPYREELMDLYQCFFVRMDGMHRVSAEEIKRLKKLRPNIMILPHYHVGSLTGERKDAKALQDILSQQMFPVPYSMETISIQDFQELHGLFTSCDEFFMNTARISALMIPDAKISTEYHSITVETVPESLLPTEERRRTLLLEIREICLTKLHAQYEGENLEYGIALLDGELKDLYNGKYHGFLLAKTLLSLYRILSEIDRECCILVRFFHLCPVICWLLGLSRYDPIVHEPEGSIHADIITSMNFLELETSYETYTLIRDKLKNMFPLRVAEVCEEQTVGELLKDNTYSARITNAMKELDCIEKQSLKNAVVAFRPSSNHYHSLVIAPDGMYISGFLLEDTTFPYMVPTYLNLTSVSTMNLSFYCSETIARYERVNEQVLKKYISKITKTVEKQLFEDFIPKIDRVMAAGILELTPLIRKQIRERKPRNRQALADIFHEYLLFEDYYLSRKYFIGLVDIIISMLVASLSHPQEYFAAVDIGDHDLTWYPDEILERIVYDGGAADGQVDEVMEALLIDNNIPTEHYIRESTNKDRPLLEYAKRKRYYPQLILAS